MNLIVCVHKCTESDHVFDFGYGTIETFCILQSFVHIHFISETYDVSNNYPQPISELCEV